MATKQKHSTKVVIEELVDLFLEDTLDVDSSKVPHPQASRHIFGATQSDAGVQEGAIELPDDVMRDAHLKDIGRNFAKAGDQFLSSRVYSREELDVRAEISCIAQRAGEARTKEEEEGEWNRFKEIIGRSLEDAGVTNPFKIMAAVLVTIKGLGHLEESARLLARRFTLRFFEERHLDKDIERIGGIENAELD